MPTGGSSFLSNLTKRKKSPEQLVKLAVACLHELPPVNDDAWTCPQEGKAPSSMRQPPSLENLTIEENKSLHATGTGADELAASAQSLTSSEGNSKNHTNPDVAARPASGSDAPVASMARRPSFFSAFGKKESSSSADTPHQQASLGSSSGGGEVSSGGEAKPRPALTRPPSLSVSKFFLDANKKQPSSGPTSPHGLSHSSSLGQTEDGTTMERLAKRLSQMKLILYGDGEKEVDKEKCVDLAEHVIKEGLMPLLLDHYTHLPFEARKDAASIFNNIARHNHGGFADPYIVDHFAIIEKLINGYGHPDVALNCGQMLREAARHEKVARRILFSPYVWPFFDTYVHLPNFDVASDSFATLRDLLTKHKNVAGEFLEKEYDQVFTKYKALLSSDNYVTRRMSLKMLGEVLLDRSNFNVMMKYISSKGTSSSVPPTHIPYSPSSIALSTHFLAHSTHPPSSNREPQGHHEPAAGQERVHPVRGLPRLQGLRGQPQETPRNRQDPGDQQGEAGELPDPLPHGQGRRPIQRREVPLDQHLVQDGDRRGGDLVDGGVGEEKGTGSAGGTLFFFFFFCVLPCY